MFPKCIENARIERHSFSFDEIVRFLHSDRNQPAASLSRLLRQMEIKGQIAAP